jgi:hypothetical protein
MQPQAKRLIIAISLFSLICGCLDDIDSSTSKEIEKAIAQKNPKLCDTLTLDSSKDTCYKKVAVGLKNPQVCQSVKNKDETDYCYHEVAVSTNSFMTCTNIKDTDQKAFCIAAVTGSTVNDAYMWANTTFSNLKKSIGI